MKVSDVLYLRFFSDNGMEAIYLDKYLMAYQDGKPREDVPSITGKLVWSQARIEEKLVKDGYLKIWGRNGTGYIITSEGKLHLETGGYKKELLYKKISRLSVWISIVAFAMSVWAFIRTF